MIIISITFAIQSIYNYHIMPKAAGVTNAIKLNTIQEAIEDIRQGKVIIVVDDEDRENEGDFLAAAEMVTPEMINFMATHGRGLICAPITEQRCEDLKLSMMVDNNTDPMETAFTISVDLKGKGVTTGISASDRAKTVEALIHPETKYHELARPGHIFPLKAKQGGVLRRTGHTEAAIDFARLAGLKPAGVIVMLLPLSLMGVFLGFWLSGTPISFPAMIGIVALAGIIVNDSIVLIDRINHDMKKLNDKYAAFQEAGRSRMQPIILTSITTIFGLLPLALSDPIWEGLGFAIIYGMTLATFLTVVLVPCLMVMYEDITWAIATVVKWPFRKVKQLIRSNETAA